MKDLKHLLYFENLLQNANNELIEQAKKDGKICAAFTCENIPEPLMNLGNAFSVRLFAPNSGSLDIATYYMTNLLCETSRALLERAVEGGFNFAECLIAADGCTMMNRAAENMHLLHTMDEGKKNFFYEFMEIPLKADENGVELLVLQCKNHILKPLHEKYGIDISDEAILKAVEEHNHVCRLIRELGEFRRIDFLTEMDALLAENPRNGSFHDMSTTILASICIKPRFYTKDIVHKILDAARLENISQPRPFKELHHFLFALKKAAEQDHLTSVVYNGLLTIVPDCYQDAKYLKYRRVTMPNVGHSLSYVFFSDEIVQCV